MPALTVKTATISSPAAANAAPGNGSAKGDAAGVFGAILAQLDGSGGAANSTGQQNPQGGPALAALVAASGQGPQPMPVQDAVSKDAATSQSNPLRDEKSKDAATADASLLAGMLLQPPPPAPQPVQAPHDSGDRAGGEAKTMPAAAPPPALLAPGEGNAADETPPANAPAHKDFVNLIVAAKNSTPAKEPAPAPAPQSAPQPSPAPAPTTPSAAVPGTPLPENGQDNNGGRGNSHERQSASSGSGAAKPADSAASANPGTVFQPQLPADAAAQTLLPSVPPPSAITLQVGPKTQADGANAVPLSDLGLIALNIAAQSKDGIKHFDIALHPAELGSIQVHLSVDASGGTQAHLTAGNPQTLQLLQQDAPQLAQALKDAGLNLTGGGLNFSLKGEQQSNGGHAPRTPGRNLAISTIAAADTASANAYAAGPSSARVDIQV